MLKRAMAAIQKQFFPDRHDKNSTQCDEITRAARRQFFSRATLGAASITGTAGLTKMAIDAVPQPDLHQRYAKDATNGEQELIEREYVLMSKQEVENMVQTFTRNHANKN
jgi:hypothetical protein